MQLTAEGGFGNVYRKGRKNTGRLQIGQSLYEYWLPEISEDIVLDVVFFSEVPAANDPRDRAVCGGRQLDVSVPLLMVFCTIDVCVEALPEIKGVAKIRLGVLVSNDGQQIISSNLPVKLSTNPPDFGIIIIVDPGVNVPRCLC